MKLKIDKNKKVLIISIIGILIIVFTVVFPTFARFQNRTSMQGTTVWDGITVANSFRKGNGSINNPYIISNGSELAYFEKKLEEENFEGMYVSLNSDIILNKGLFSYSDEQGLLYTLDNVIYYVKDGKYYSDQAYEKEVGTLNKINSLDKFKGTFNGDFHTIYGYYLDGSDKDNVALFTNLEGAINNLYVENIYIKGGKVTAGLVSDAKNAIINNVVVSGNVFNRESGFDDTLSTNLEDIILNETSNLEIDIINENSYTGLDVESKKLKGKVQITNPNSNTYNLEINGEKIDKTSFEIDLDSDLLNINFEKEDEELEIKITDLKYEINVVKSLAAGIVAKAENTNLINVVNKANIYGVYNAAGLMAEQKGTTEIRNSYNKGNINATNITGGILGASENSSNIISILSSYNLGETVGTYHGGLIGLVNNISEVNMDSCIAAEETEFALGAVLNTIVNANDTYYVNGILPIYLGDYQGMIYQETLENLSNNAYFKQTIGYNEYVSKNDLQSNSDNIWVYEENELPILYFDDIENPIAKIHAGVYSWNNYSNEIDRIGFKNTINFSIENIDDLKPFKQAYYYVQKGQNLTPLTKDQINDTSLEWTLFDGVITYEEEGEYIIYAKIISDTDSGEITQYINSDQLVLDNNIPIVTIEMDNNVWQEFNESPDEFVLDRTKTVSISATDTLSGVEKIEYYISEEPLTYENFEQLSDKYFKEYDETLQISEVGNQIIYVKVTDLSGNISYANTDKFILDGYIQSSIYPGTEKAEIEGNYITSKSSITIETSYNNDGTYDSTHKHNLKTNILMPKGTKITLIDYVYNKVYTYIISTDADEFGFADNGVATYPFSLFSEVGRVDNDVKYKEQSYETSGKINEDYAIAFDFNNAIINESLLNVQAYLELTNISSKTIRPTLYDQTKTFNVILDNGETPLSLKTDYSANLIEINSNSQTNIGFESKLLYNTINENIIYNTKYELMKIGVGIKLIDEEGNIITKDKMTNMIFIYNDKEYYPSADNIVHIDLNNKISDVNDVITIKTIESDVNLKEGTYYFKIFNYISYDGFTLENINPNELMITASLTNNKTRYEFEFDVNMDKADQILSSGYLYNIPFEIKYTGEIVSPSIKLALYKKSNLNPVNQDYELIDLKDFNEDELELYINSVYNVKNTVIDYSEEELFNNYELNINTENMEKNGYKFQFQLYDGNKLITTIDKYFIVK